MAQLTSCEISVQGMDCADCTRAVQRAISALPGVERVEVYLAGEKASVRYDPALVDLPRIRAAVAGAGYRAPEADAVVRPNAARSLPGAARPLGVIFGGLFAAALVVVIFGEWLGWFERITTRVPWPVGVGLTLLFGFPVFKSVIRATLHGQVISHTLMTVGAAAALAVGEWTTAAVVVFFMRVGDFVESYTTNRARQAVRGLTAMTPQTARVERGGAEIEIPAAEVRAGEVVIVRPGEIIPVDGEVCDGQATIQQATITGEPMPVEAGAGSRVYAATIAQLGSLRVRAVSVGVDTTFGRVTRLVEEAETNRAEAQRLGDRVSSYYLPVVAVIAGSTYLIGRDPLAAAAVLLVACSCSFALATPIAMLASIGAAARQGILIKGGKYIELLARADTLLIDKTGTLTVGQPAVTDVVGLNGLDETELLRLAASAERYSEHPLAEAVRREARTRQIELAEPVGFQAAPGLGVRARVGARLRVEGRTLLYVRVDGETAGILAAADRMRPEASAALAELRRLGIRRIELLTGDHQQAAAAAAGELGIDFQAGLLPEDKIRIVQEYQARGRVVVMVGDGVNDAPALAQAHVGIAMGATGSDVAMEAAHIALMKDDWMLLPRVYEIARRTMGVVKMNLGFTIAYNLVGLTLAAVGLLPPALAAAAQSLPDLGILGNSSRLLRQK